MVQLSCWGHDRASCIGHLGVHDAVARLAGCDVSFGRQVVIGIGGVQIEKACGVGTCMAAGYGAMGANDRDDIMTEGHSTTAINLLRL